MTEWIDDTGAFIDRAGPRYASDTGHGLAWLVPAVETKADATGSTVTTFVASTAAVDRMGDVVEQSTWRLANWRRNPVVLHEHAPPVVGRGAGSVSKGDDDSRRLVIRVTWDESEHNPIGRMIADQHRNGFRFASSVGFRPGKVISRRDLADDDPRRIGDDVPRYLAGSVFRYCELLELSSVAIPANPEAVQLSVHARSFSGNDAIKAFLDANTATVRAAVLDAVKADETIRAALLDIVLCSNTLADQAGNSDNDKRRALPWLRRS